MNNESLKRYVVSFLLLLGCCLTLSAQSSGDGYDPDNPTEPGEAGKLASYKITATANIAEAGTVTGSGTYKYGTTVTLKATTNSGYKFLYWQESGSDDTYSTSSSVSITVGTANVAFVAVYEKLKTVTLSLNDEKAGSVSGDGLYQSGSTATLTATENIGYKFKYWSLDGGTTEYSTSSTLSYTVGEEDVNLMAVFDIPHTVTLKINNEEAGTVQYQYCYSGSDTENVYARLTATVNPIFSFKYWLRNDEEEPYSTETTFDYKLDADVTFTGVFAYNPDDPGEPEEAKSLATYYLNVVLEDADAGIVSGNGKYVAGKSVTVSTSPNSGYEFKYWMKGDDVYSYDATFTYTTTAEDVTFKAVYEYVGVPEPEPTAHNVYLVAGVEGSCTFSIANGTSVDIGSAYSVTATPATDFTFDGWYINGELVGSNVTFNSIMDTEDVTLTAKCTYSPGNPADPSSSETEEYIKNNIVGDIDGTGVVNVSDAVDLITHYLNNTTGELKTTIADVDNNGVINVSDAIEIIQIYLNNK